MVVLSKGGFMWLGMIILLVLLSQSAFARSDSNAYRCGNNLVQLGDSLYEVQDLSGRSDGSYQWQETVTLHRPN